MKPADHKWLPVVVLLFMSVVFTPTPSRAQAETPAGSVTYGLEKGDSLRIGSSPFDGRATLLEAERDTLTVLARRLQGPITIPTNSISSLEHYRKLRWTRRAVEGAKWGGVVGAGFGTLGIIMSERGPGDPPRILWPPMWATIFAAPTAVIAAILPFSGWEKVPLPVQARVEVETVGSGLTVRLRW